MSDTPLPDGELLVSRYLDGEITPDEHAQLQQWLREDSAHFDLFAKRAIDHHRTAELLRVNTMADLVDLEETDDDDNADIMSEVVASALAERRRHELEDAANRKLAAQQAADARNRRFELRRQAEPEAVKRVVVIPKAAVWLGLVAALGLIAWIGWPASDTMKSDTLERTELESSNSTMAMVPAIVAMVRDSADARWVGHDDPNDYLREGQQLTLTHGHAEIVMGQGAVIIIEGPATVELVSANAIRLTEGRIAGSVPVTAAGFALHTPAGVVASAGANAFGVLVRDDASTDLQAFRGELVLPHFGGEAPTTLEAGSAARLDVRSSEVRFGRARPIEFVRSMDHIDQDRRTIVSRFESPGSTGRQRFDPNDGEGWRGPWELSTEYGQTQLYTETQQPLSWDTDRYLSFTQTAHPTRPSRATLTRSYDSYGTVDRSKPHTIRFSFRLDTPFSRSGFEGNKLAIFDGVADVPGSSGRNTWSLHAFPERTTGPAVHSNTWLVYDGTGVIDLEQTDYSRLVSTGIPIVAGDVYEFEITVRPRRSEWDLVIVHGEERYSSAEALGRPLRFRSARNRVYGNLNFNLWIEAGAERGISIDDVAIEPAPSRSVPQ